MSAVVADDAHAAHARRALWALVGLALTIGASTAAVDARQVEEPPVWTLIYNLGFGALTFAWVHFDSLRRDYRPSLLLRLGVVLLAVVALPWYLIRSRRGAQRWLSLVRLAGFFVVLVGAASFGYGLAAAVL
jgi:cell division protein FtsW (lipid II flippase)